MRSAVLKPPSEVESYDEYLSSFVDAVQLGDLDFQQLFDEWFISCPPEWHLRFTEDAAEIESLIQSGAFLEAMET